VGIISTPVLPMIERHRMPFSSWDLVAEELYYRRLGLLMAGISVPCLFGGMHQKWLAWLGIILAVLAELSTLSLMYHRQFGCFRL